MPVGAGDASALAKALSRLFVGDALEVAAPLHQLGELHFLRGFAAEKLDDAARLVPAHRQHQRGRRIERLHRSEREDGRVFLLLHVEAGGPRGAARGQPGEELETGLQIPGLCRHQPAHLPEHERFGIRRPHGHELSLRAAPPRLAALAHHAHALRALVLDRPVLDGEAVGFAVVVLVPGAHAAKSRDLVALLLRELLLVAGLPERAPGEVVVNGDEVAAHVRGAAGALAIGHAAGLALAPLAVEENEKLLTRRLHAVLAKRQLGRWLSFAQQADAVAQALRELAGVEIADVGAAWRGFHPLRAA